MVVSLTLPNRDMATALVAAVVNSYKTEVVDFEADQKRARFSKVNRAVVKKDQDIRNKRQELRNLVTKVGSVDPGTLRQRVQAFYARLNILETQLAQMQGKYGELRSELEANKELLKSVNKIEVPPADLDILIHSDPVAEPLARQVAELKMSLERMRRSLKPGATTP